MVVEHGDECALTKLARYCEVWQVGDAQAVFGHKDQRFERAYNGCPGQFDLDARLSRRQRPSLELSACWKLMVQTGMSLEVVRGQRDTLGRQIGPEPPRGVGDTCPMPGLSKREVASVGEAHDSVEAHSSMTSTTRSLKSRSNMRSRDMPS